MPLSHWLPCPRPCSSETGGHWNTDTAIPESIGNTLVSEGPQLLPLTGLDNEGLFLNRSIEHSHRVSRPPPLSLSRGPRLMVTYHPGNSALTVSGCIILLSDRPYDFTCFLLLRYLIHWGFQDVFGLQSKTTVWHTEECFITSPENKVFLRKTISLQPHATPSLPYRQLL